jgi:hypothetical protein
MTIPLRTFFYIIIYFALRPLFTQHSRENVFNVNVFIRHYRLKTILKLSNEAVTVEVTTQRDLPRRSPIHTLTAPDIASLY